MRPITDEEIRAAKRNSNDQYEFWNVKFSQEQIKDFPYSFSACVFEHCSFESLDLANFWFYRANFIDCKFEKANLGYADFTEATLRQCSFAEANLERATFCYADLNRTSFQSANLKAAFLKYVKARFIHLEEANLRDAHLAYGNFEEGNFINADLTDACFTGSILTSANLSRAKGLKSSVDMLKELGFEFTPEGLIVYKTFGEYNDPNPDWVIAPGSIITENVCYDRTVECGSGVNVSNIEWQKNRYLANYEVYKLLIRNEWLPGVVVPFNSNGKIRCEKAEIVCKMGWRRELFG